MEVKMSDSADYARPHVIIEGSSSNEMILRCEVEVM